MNRLVPLSLATQLFVLLFASLATAQSPDCNTNGVVDSADLASSGLTITSMGGVSTEGTILTGTLLDVNLDGNKDLIAVKQVSGVASAMYAVQEADVFTLNRIFDLPISPTGIALGDFDNNAFVDIGFATTSSQANAFNLGNDTFNVLGRSSVGERAHGGIIPPVAG
jgi:hypothetical protein